MFILYFPTFWNGVIEVEWMHKLLEVLLDRGVPSFWWGSQRLHWMWVRKWWCWLVWIFLLCRPQCSGHVDCTMANANGKWHLQCQGSKANQPDWRQLEFQVFKGRNFHSNRFHDFGPSNCFWQHLQWQCRTHRTESKNAINNEKKLGACWGRRQTSGQISARNTQRFATSLCRLIN